MFSPDPDFEKCYIAGMGDDLSELWSRLTADERWAVFTARRCATKTEAARRIGKSAKWLENSQARHPTFRQALDRRSEWPDEDLLAMMTGELVASAFVVLREAMFSTVLSQTQRLSAAKAAAQLTKSLGLDRAAIGSGIQAAMMVRR